MTTLSVVMATRLEKSGDKLFVERAIESIRSQKTDLELQIIIGVDPGVKAELPGVEIVESPRANLSAVLNEAAKRIEGQFVAFFEDDDEWMPGHLAGSFSALAHGDFVSGTQLVVNENGRVHHINDFPTPDTWVMRREIWDKVGGFSEEFAVHQDHDWLGKLSMAGVSRVHLVEASAPDNHEAAIQLRPWLATLSESGQIRLARHTSPWPLVKRLRRSASWTGQIRSGERAAISQDCYARIQAKFGCVPW